MAVQLENSASTPSQSAQIPSSSLPLGAQLLHLLSSLQSLALNTFQQASTLNPPNPTSSYSDLLALDGQLRSLLVLVSSHAQKQARIESLLAQLTSAEQTYQATLHTLHSSKTALDPIIKSGAADREAISAATSAALDPSTVLSYARLLAPFTSAPPQSIFTEEERRKGLDPSGRSLPEGARPPFPTEGVMRRGRLQFGKLGEEGEEERGETGEVGARNDGKTNASAAEDDKKAELTAHARLERQARQQDQPPPAQEEFTFDLDLNPDL